MLTKKVNDVKKSYFNGGSNMLYFRQINRAVDFWGTGSLKEEG